MGRYGRHEFVERLRNYEQTPCSEILTMNGIQKLLGNSEDYDIEKALKKCIVGMTKRNIKSYVIKLNEESNDSLEDLTPLDEIEISLLLTKAGERPLRVAFDGHLLRMQQYTLIERETGQRYHYIKIDCVEKQKSLDGQREQ